MRNQPTFLHEIYEFSGTPYEIGFQRGKLMAKPLKKMIETITYQDAYHDLGPEPESYNLDYFKENYPSQFKEWEKALEKTPEWFREEAHGNADGAGIQYEKLIIAPTWFPFFIREKNRKSRLRIPNHEDCNGFMAYGKATVDGRVIVTRNAESDHENMRWIRIVRMKNKTWNNFIALGYEPWLMGGCSGINDKGVCVMGNGVSIKDEEHGDFGYLGARAARRRVLQEANNVDEAIDIFKEGPLLGGNHHFLGDQKRAVHIEATGKRIKVIDPESGFDASASPYFSNPKMTPFCDVMVDETDPDFNYTISKKRGVFRMERYHEIFQEKKPLTLDIVPSILGDHGGRGTRRIPENIEGACKQGSDYTICVHGGPSHGHGGTTGTTGSFHSSALSTIAVPDEMKLYIAFGSPCECGYVPFRPPK